MICSMMGQHIVDVCIYWGCLPHILYHIVQESGKKFNKMNRSVLLLLKIQNLENETFLREQIATWLLKFGKGWSVGDRKIN